MFSPFPLPALTPGEWGLISTWIWRIFADFADSMPPIPENSGYWKTTWFNFVQKLASNSTRVVVRKPNVVVQDKTQN